MARTFQALLALVILLAGTAVAQTTINGAGATFPNPIYQKWFAEYQKTHASVRFNYQSLGSGAGISQVQQGTVDFGATDGPMSDEQLQKAKVQVLHVPTVLGAVVPAYNLQGVADLKFTPEALAGIFLGRIRKWNDAAITSVNPGVHLPNSDIVVVRRSDGSGTTYVWTDYLSKVSPEWQQRVGKGTAVRWPIGLGAKGSEGVTGQIRNTPGAMGYVELTYAIENKIPFGSVRNSAGTFVKASLESTTAAAASVKAMPADFRVSITNAPGQQAYPVASFTWLLIPTHAKDPTKGKMIAEFVNWMLGPGQKLAPTLNYAPLPAGVVSKVQAAAAQLK